MKKLFSRYLPVLAIVLAMIAMTLGGVALTQSPSPTPMPGEEEAQAPPELEEFAMDWPLIHKDYEATRANLDAEISSEKVDMLEEGWTLEAGANGQWTGASLLILGNSTFLQGPDGSVYSVGIEDGELLWAAAFDAQEEGSGAVAAGWEKIFAVAQQTEVAALDRETGEEVWRMSPENETDMTSGQLSGRSIIPFANYVFVGTMPGEEEEESRALIHAVNQEDGNITWSLMTEDLANMTDQEESQLAGLAIVTAPAIDQETGIMYWPVASQDGDGNATALIAVAAETGEIEWIAQAESSILSSPVLAEANNTAMDNTTQMVVALAQGGEVLAFDRETGEMAWSATLGMQGENETQQADLDEIEMMLSPMASAEGMLFVAYRAAGNQTEDGSGGLAAIDLMSGEIAWESPVEGTPTGGATVAGDLVFTATEEGTIYAFMSEDGSEVWTYEASGAIAGWPAVASDTIVWPIGGEAGAGLLALRLGGMPGEGTPAPTPEDGTPPPPAMPDQDEGLPAW